MRFFDIPARKMSAPSRGEWLWALLRQRVPVIAWLPEYDRTKFICDLIAGVTVGLTVIPQALAYSTLAGLEPQVKFNFLLFLHSFLLQKKMLDNFSLYQMP